MAARRLLRRVKLRGEMMRVRRTGRSASSSELPVMRMEETEFGRSTLEKREEEERKEQIQFQFSVSESVFILLWINKVLS